MTAIQELDRQRFYLAACLTIAFISAVGALFWKGIPTDNKDLVNYMLGQLSGMTTMALGLYFLNKAGQDAADDKKTENTGKMADAITAAANAGTSPDLKAAATKAADKVADAAVVAAEEVTDTAAGLAAGIDGDIKK